MRCWVIRIDEDVNQPHGVFSMHLLICLIFYYLPPVAMSRVMVYSKPELVFTVTSITDFITAPSPLLTLNSNNQYH